MSAVRKVKLLYNVGAESAIIPVRGASNNVRVPDLVVAPANDKNGDQVVADPIVIVEILSPGNSEDTRDNIPAYATLSSVREIIVVHSTRILAKLHHRDTYGDWVANPEIVSAGAALVVASVNLDIAIEEVYANTWLTRTT